jgi:predicted membrane protein
MNMSWFVQAVRLLLIIGGAFLCASAFWGAVVVAIAQQVLHVHSESILLGLFIGTSATCLILCILVLPKFLGKTETG